MAERVIHQLIDDINGVEIADGDGERVDFSLRRVRYHIDLSSANVAKLDKALKPYVDAATKVGGSRAKRAKGDGAGTHSPKSLAAIRDWARENGFDVSDRGRIRRDVLDAFGAAH